jgi:hypothetical protein
MEVSLFLQDHQVLNLLLLVAEEVVALVEVVEVAAVV